MFGVVVLTLAAAPRARAEPASFEATVLPQLDPTDSSRVLTSTQPRGINERQDVIGWLGFGQGFVWSPQDGDIAFDALFANTRSQGEAINNAGAFVGHSCAQESLCLPFVYEPDEGLTMLSTGDASLAGAAADLNEAGMVVGSLGDGFNSGSVAAAWVDGELIEINDPAWMWSTSTSVNNYGVATVNAIFTDVQGVRAYRWTLAEGLEELPSISAMHATRALDSNDEGVVVGVSFEDVVTPHPVYWDPNGTLHVLEGLLPPVSYTHLTLPT
ncbi:MAG: DUF3466 family protein, partial [Nannocystaceae bacterium]|nr:DUF3466 family protein [Nannocystaceae bacterium]